MFADANFFQKKDVSKWTHCLMFLYQTVTKLPYALHSPMISVASSCWKNNATSRWLTLTRMKEGTWNMQHANTTTYHEFEQNSWQLRLFHQDVWVPERHVLDCCLHHSSHRLWPPSLRHLPKIHKPRDQKIHKQMRTRNQKIRKWSRETRIRNRNFGHKIVRSKHETLRKHANMIRTRKKAR